MPRRFTSAVAPTTVSVELPETLHITSGPERPELISALENTVSGKKVEFVFHTGSTRMKYHAMARITALEHSGGRADHWNFKAIADLPIGERRIEGYYVPFTKNGHFSVK